MTQENIKFKCNQCGNLFIAEPQDYKTIFWNNDIIKEGYCPVCGHVNQINMTRGFSGSGGGKF